MNRQPNATYHSPMIQTRIVREQRDALDRAAQTLGVSRSEVMRRGIAHMIEVAKVTEKETISFGKVLYVAEPRQQSSR